MAKSTRDIDRIPSCFHHQLLPSPADNDRAAVWIPSATPTDQCGQFQADGSREAVSRESKRVREAVSARVSDRTRASQCESERVREAG